MSRRLPVKSCARKRALISIAPSNITKGSPPGRKTSSPMVHP
jgi:hypothetical protein